MIHPEHPDGNFKPVSKYENNQSVYHDYNEAFTGYDQIRHPHGVKEILNILRQLKLPITEQIVLEGGFGTGSYLEQIRHYVQMINGIEGSDEGYRQTLEKVKSTPNVELQKGNILQLPYSEKTFHAYMVNQVIHHLDHRQNFQSMNAFLSEASRVLKNDGVLIINTCSQAQLNPDSGSYWHYKYIYPAADSIRKHYIPIQELEMRLERLGLIDINRTIPSEKLFCQRYYNDPSIALEPEFRKGDSSYSFLSEVELEESNSRLRRAIEDGSVRDVMSRSARRIAEIGEAVIISARKKR